MNLVEELKYLCTYVLAVADADLPAQLKYELIFTERVVDEIDHYISLGDIYGLVDKDWESHEEEVKEYAAIIAKLLADLEKIDDQG